MSLIFNRKATCPECGDTNQTYSYYIYWHSASGNPIPQIGNFCTSCGAMIYEKDSKETRCEASLKAKTLFIKE